MRIGGLALVALLGCTAGADDLFEPDAGAGADAEAAPRPDAAAPGPDATPEPASLSELRGALFAGYTDGDACDAWAALDDSQRAVFLTLTDRLYKSMLPDGTTMLAHVDALYAILGGGSDGGDCGGGENNRLFLSMDDALWELMVAAWNDELWIQDGGGGDTFWARTNDLAGPHDPFDASSETQAGLHCILITELPDSRPPTGQAHFFLEGSETRVERGDGIRLDADPRMLEIDHDYDCFHQSNPTCWDFADRYLDHYGDYEADWAPAGC